MTVAMTIQRRIAVLMAERGWQQADLARELKVSTSAFGERYRGRRAFRLHEIVQLAGIFDIAIDELLEGMDQTTEYHKARIRGEELRDAQGGNGDD